MFGLFFKKEKIGKTITRIAPSPTGKLHIGTARTALFNYLYAKKNSGTFILRIEDTDKERSKEEFEKDIIEGLTWLGLDFDQKYKQSERIDIYKKYLKKLIDSGNAYISKEEKGERGEVIRFKNPNKVMSFEDMIRGTIKFDTTELGDFVIAKSLDEPLYHLAVVVDDHEMDITDIIRGDDMISNTPRQILIQEAIGAKRPNYTHLPIILAKDKSKLSKRHGAVSLVEFRDKGYLKEAIINFIALLGWNPGDDRELFTLNELVTEFSLEKIGKGGAIFNEDKLNWFNREYIKKLDNREFTENIFKQTGELNKEQILKLRKIIQERINIFSDIKKMLADGELNYFINKPTYEKNKIMWKDSVNLDETKKHLIYLREKLENHTNYDKESIKALIWEYAEENGKGNVLWPLRYTLSGKDKSPDPFELAEILGKDETLSRIDSVIALIDE